MDKKVFIEGMDRLATCFPTLDMSEKKLNTRHDLLQDIPDADFKKAVIELCQTQKELYPNSNVVAMIREIATRTPEPIPPYMRKVTGFNEEGPIYDGGMKS